jgi:CheY-like chemotaxis protein
MEDRVSGYIGPRHVVLVADDDEAQRNLVKELLEPLGFEVMAASDGRECVTLAEQCKPSLILLDIALPEMDGWGVALHLRRSMRERPAILMLSANAIDTEHLGPTERLYDDYLMKPVMLRQLLNKIHALLDIEWVHAKKETQNSVSHGVSRLRALPPQENVDELIRLGESGHVRQIHDNLTRIVNEMPECATFVAHMRSFITTFEIKRYLAALEAIRSPHALECAPGQCQIGAERADGP